MAEGDLMTELQFINDIAFFRKGKTFHAKGNQKKGKKIHAFHYEELNFVQKLCTIIQRRKELQN